MSKPSTFQAEYVVTEHTSYQKASERGHAGHLHIGRVVWLDAEMSSDQRPERVTAYLEPEGFVHIDAQCLKPAPPAN